MEIKYYKREKYLQRIRPFYESDIIKVITGIRRSGKSTILLSIIDELKEKGVSSEYIIYLSLDSKKYRKIKSCDDLEKIIDSFIIHPEQKYYLFIDEVQNVGGFESLINAYREEGYSIFITGSNSYLLSDEISTKLTGRYLTFEIFTLDFKEYLEMKQFFHRSISEDLLVEFDEFMKDGGFPKSLEFVERSDRRYYCEQIVEEIFVKDVKTRNKIRNILAFERVQSYILNNFASPFSIMNVVNVFKKMQIAIKPNTIRNYIDEMKKAKLIYECNRFDLKSKKSLKREQKYYLADTSLFFVANVNNTQNYGLTLENLVYLYLVSNGYQVSFGKIRDDLECDFIVRNKNNEYFYIQVAFTLHGEHSELIKEREYRPFRYIRDGYPRFIVTLDRLRDQQEGVHHINAIDLFLGNVHF